MRKSLFVAVVVLVVFSVSLWAFAGNIKSVGKLLEEAKKVVHEISVGEAYREYYPKIGKGVVFIDVRSMDEVRKYGYIPGAELIPRGFLEFAIGRLLPNGDEGITIVVYCQTGKRSLLSAKTLKDMGYSRVLSMRGGFLKWRAKGYPVKHLP